MTDDAAIAEDVANYAYHIGWGGAGAAHDYAMMMQDRAEEDVPDDEQEESEE